MLIKHEAYKLLIKNKLLFVAVAAIVIQCLLWSMSVYVPHYHEYNDQLIYEDYAARYGIEISDEEKEEIKYEYYDLLFARDDFDKLSQQYANGEITEDEYQNQAIPLQSILSKETVLKEIYGRFVLGEENYLLLENGWTMFLSSIDIEVCTLAVIVIFVILAVKCERDNSMTALNLTSRKGRSRLAAVKIFSILLFAALFSFVMYYLKLLIYLIKFGSVGAGIPATAIDFLASSGLKLSILQTAVVFSMVKAAGLIYLTLMILFVVVFFKSVATTATFAICMLFIPSYIASKNPDDNLFYRLPLPNGLLRVRGYFLGDCDISSYYSQLVFTKLTGREKATALILDAVIMLILLLASYFKLSGRTFRLPFKRKRKLLALACVGALMLSGCAADESSFTFEKDYSSRYVWVLDTIYDKEKNECVMLDKDPFEDVGYMGLFGDTLVVSRVDSTFDRTDNPGYYAFDMKTGEEELIYSRSPIYDYTGLMDLDEIYPNVLSLFADIDYGEQQMVCFDGTQLCVIYSNRVEVIDIESGHVQTCLENRQMSNADFADGKIYFMNENRFIVCFDCQSGKEEVVINKPCSEFYLNSCGINFKGYASSQSYFYSFSGEEMLELPLEMSSVVSDTSQGWFMGGTMFACFYDKQSHTITSREFAAPVFAADDDGVYGMEFSDTGRFVVMFDYEGNELMRCPFEY